jgi:hypothetical protein
VGRRGHHALSGVAGGVAVGVVASALAGCIPPREPSRHLGGEAFFLGAYVHARTSACAGGAYELAMAPRPSYVIDTYPAIYESAWELRACGQTSRFTLDCAMRGETWSCGAHEWPTPWLPQDYALAHEIEAVALRAPACPAARSCASGSGAKCAEDGLVVRRLPRAPSSSADMASYDVARCGVVVAVNVRCSREAPFQCVTVASTPVDYGAPAPHDAAPSP